VGRHRYYAGGHWIVVVLAQSSAESERVMDTVDWGAIRAEYEAGTMSLRRLALAHGVSKTYLIERRDRENWQKPTTDRPPTDHLIKPISRGSKGGTKVPTTPPLTTPAPRAALEIARLGLALLGQCANVESLTLNEHKLLADSLSQYVKVLVTAPQDDGSQGIMIDLAKLSPAKRIALKQLLAAPESEAM
jgi:hypothetical protein